MIVHKKVKLIISGVILLAALVVAYTLFSKERTHHHDDHHHEHVSTSRAGSLGTLFVSMAESGESYDAVSTYTYAAGGDGAPGFVSLLELPNMPLLQTAVQVRPDGTMGDFFMAHVPGAAAEFLNVLGEDADPQISASEYANIVRTNFHEGGWEYVVPKEEELIGHRHLNWNESEKKLLFTAQRIGDIIQFEESVETETPSEEPVWGVYLYDEVSGSVQRIADGYAPHWLSGQEVVFVTETGLAHYNIATKELQQFAIVSGTDTSEVFTASDMLNIEVSSDGELLAVSSPQQNMLMFFDVSTDAGLTLAVSEEYAHIYDSEQVFHWPTFSPDGTHVAVQVTDVTPLGEQKNPRIEIIDLETQMVVDAISLRGYDFTRSYIDDWIK